MRIGAVTVDPPVILAPMSGITDVSFRRLCREQGAGLVCTGMISANAMHYGSEKTGDLLAFAQDEHPVCAQIFGAEPDIVAHAAVEAERRGACIVDLNMGCAVPKVLSARSGAALMAEPERAEAMVRAVVAAVRAPVTVKIRCGWHDRGEQAVAFARRCERAGAAAVTVHPRWAGQQFRGRADWGVIGEVKQAVGVPVIGNGDIHSAADARRMMGETGCEGVMIGRAALGNPWVFRQAAGALRGGPALAPPSIEERLAMAARHARMVVANRGEKVGVREMRKHFAWYLKAMPGARSLRDRANRATTLQQLLRVLEEASAEAAAQAAAGRGT
jgi:nifR3 family TIM-barrel protein